LLSISQVAAATGLTVRAVRHYHACGLLAEPPRDRSGYRRYGATDIIALVRIRTLASAGVPLARIKTLLEGTPAEYTESLRTVDEDLRLRIRALEQHRRDLAQLDDPERLCLPAAAADVQDRLRAIGLSERTLAHFRDGWILVAAISPEEIEEAAAWTYRWLDDETYRRLLLEVDAAADWSPEDPRLEALAEAAVDLDERIRAEEGDQAEFNGYQDGSSRSLLNTFNAVASPAWGRLDELIAQIRSGRDHPETVADRLRTTSG
jgi:DNA-binding transcriptional MerR regulator